MNTVTLILAPLVILLYLVISVILAGIYHAIKNMVRRVILSRTRGSAMPHRPEVPFSHPNVLEQELTLAEEQWFTLRHFFAHLFKRHTSDDVELAASVGFIETTPTLNASMSHITSPWLFFRLFSFSIGAFFIFYATFIMSADINLIPGLIIIGSFAIPTSILALFFEWNTPKNVSIVLLARFLIAGSALAILSALYFYTWGSAIGFRSLIIAGPVEETAKLLAVVYVTRPLDRARYRYTLNGILFGAAVGAGFAAFESAGFAFQSLLNNGVGGATVSIVMRGMLSPFGHIIWTAISGGIFWLRRKKHNTIVETLIDWRFLAVFSIPVALHTIWDNVPSLPYDLNYILLGAIGWAVVFALLEVGYHEVARYSKMQGLIQK